MSVQPGQTVSHYRLVEKIGEGGMGVVWKAEDTRLGRFVALKFVPESAAQDETRVERFLREARTASALNHNNICTIYDIGEWEKRHYIAMELLDGPTLMQRIAGQPLEPDTIVELGIQLADALAAAHAKGIVHRDIKTTNVIVSDRDQVKILDFGLAKLQHRQEPQTDAEAPTATRHLDLTSEGTAVGTVAYMSPEQALGKEVDARSDIFSLGVVLYEMATGRQPFSGNTSAALFDAILNRAPTTPVELNPRVPLELESIINKALEKDPELRYQSSAGLRADLKRMQRGSASSSRPAAASPTAATSHQKPTPAWWMAVAGLGIFGVLAAGYFLWPRGPEKPAGRASIRPLTSMAGLEGTGSWSPDGAFFAFSHHPGSASLFVVPTAGGDAVPLVESDAGDFNPRWSPDSRWIAFVSNLEGRNGIFLVPPLGGRVQRLADTNMPVLDFGSQLGALGGIPWSPDARKLLFSRLASDKQAAVLAPRLRQIGCHLGDRAGQSARDPAHASRTRGRGQHRFLVLRRQPDRILPRRRPVAADPRRRPATAARRRAGRRSAGRVDARWRSHHLHIERRFVGNRCGLGITPTDHDVGRSRDWASRVPRRANRLHGVRHREGSVSRFPRGPISGTIDLAHGWGERKRSHLSRRHEDRLRFGANWRPRDMGHRPRHGQRDATGEPSGLR